MCFAFAAKSYCSYCARSFSLGYKLVISLFVVIHSYASKSQPPKEGTYFSRKGLTRCRRILLENFFNSLRSLQVKGIALVLRFNFFNSLLLLILELGSRAQTNISLSKAYFPGVNPGGRGPAGHRGELVKTLCLNSQSLSSFCLDGLSPKFIYKDRRIDHTSIRRALSGKMHSSASN